MAWHTVEVSKSPVQNATKASHLLRVVDDFGRFGQFSIQLERGKWDLCKVKHLKESISANKSTTVRKKGTANVYITAYQRQIT